MVPKKGKIDIIFKKYNNGLKLKDLPKNKKNYQIRDNKGYKRYGRSGSIQCNK